MVKIPTFQNTAADFVQEINLGGQLVELRIIFDIRNQSFHLEFTDQNSNQILGIKMVPNWLLLDSHKGFTDFIGDLLILKTNEDAGDEITFDNLDNGWALNFLTPDEVSVWKTDNGF